MDERQQVDRLEDVPADQDIVCLDMGAVARMYADYALERGFELVGMHQSLQFKRIAAKPGVAEEADADSE